MQNLGITVHQRVLVPDGLDLRLLYVDKNVVIPLFGVPGGWKFELRPTVLTVQYALTPGDVTLNDVATTIAQKGAP